MKQALRPGSGEAPDIGSVFVSNYPPYSFWSDGALPDLVRALDERPRPDTPIGLYLHIPFCRKRCNFCYFRVYTDKDARDISRYLDGVAAEARLYAGRAAIAGRPLEFVYVGGGTPSFLAVHQLEDLVNRLKAALPWTGVKEVTFECEPGTLSEPKLRAIRGIGVTRLSLGIENFDDDILSANGRAHLSAEIARVRPWIRALDFAQLNVDLIAGMLGESFATWKDTVQKTIDYDPDSVTVYQMELPYNTVFTKDLQGGALPSPVASWATKREWHDYAFAELERAGFELSSAYTMVKRGRGARFVYRDSVWNGADMLGLGVASFSHLSEVHFQNHDAWGDYLTAVESSTLPVRRAYHTSLDERLTRELILQLKFGRVERERFRRKFGVDPAQSFTDAIASLQHDRFASIDNDHIELTREGLLRVDSLLPRFYAPRHRDARYT